MVLAWMLARAERLGDNPPSADWDGSWHLDRRLPVSERSGRPFTKAPLPTY